MVKMCGLSRCLHGASLWLSQMTLTHTAKHHRGTILHVI
jgi:hypothetical protein